MVKYISNKNQKKLAIVMCTKNGAPFIYEQLLSIKNQSFQDYDLYISDNESSDSTINIINAFINEFQMKNIFLLEGCNKRFSYNFIWLLKEIKTTYHYYAFCDQDDVWHNHHLERAIKKISLYKKTSPIMFCSATNLISSNGKQIGRSPKFNKNPNLRNALVQSIAGGNTMVFNHQSCKLLKNIDIDKRFVPSHDWILYALVSSCDGTILYSKNPSVDYRQHNNNIIGSNKGFIASIKRMVLIMRGHWKYWIDANLKIILDEKSLSTRNNKLLNKIIEKKNSRFIFSRLKIIYKFGLYRQTIIGNISLYFMAILKKL